MAKFKRKDLKRPDQFIVTTRKGILWASEHRSRVIGAGAALAAVLLVGIGTSSVRGANNRQANEDLSQGLNSLHAEKFADAAKALGEVAQRWQGSGPGTVAQIYAAQANLHEKNFDAAASSVQLLADSASSPDYLRQEAQVTVAAALEEKGETAQAAAEYAAAREIKDGPYTAAALLGEARCRDRAQETAKATELYQAYVEEYPTAADQAFVASRLAALKKS